MQTAVLLLIVCLFIAGSRRKPNRNRFLYTGKVLLSEREKDVLNLICAGLSTTEIADKLLLSPRTIEGHRLRMLEKTNTRNTAELVAAFGNGLV